MRTRQEDVGVGQVREQDAVPIPGVGDGGRVARDARDRGVAGLGNGDAQGLDQDHGPVRRAEERQQAACEDGPFEGAGRELPADGQVVTAAAFLHQRLDEVAAPGLKENVGRFLVGFLLPFARGRPASDGSDGQTVGRILVAGKEQLAAVVAGDPENIIARLRRDHEAAKTLAVVVEDVGRRLEQAGDDVGEGRAVREDRGVGQVGDGRARDVGVDLAQHADALGMDPNVTREQERHQKQAREASC